MELLWPLELLLPLRLFVVIGTFVGIGTFVAIGTFVVNCHWNLEYFGILWGLGYLGNLVNAIIPL